MNFAALIVAAFIATSVDRPVYVSPSGSDTEGNGTSNRPFASVDRARSFRRSRGWNSAMTSDDFVYLAAGNYYGTHVVFGPADSGSNGFVVHYQASGSAGSAVLSGGVPVTGFTVFSGGEYRALIPLNYSPRTLYENDVRAITARLPKLTINPHYPTAGDGYLRTIGVDQTNTLQYSPGDLTPGAWDLTQTRLRLWDQGASNEIDWFTSTDVISSVNAGSQQFTIQNPDGGGCKYYPFFAGGTGSGRYFVQGDVSMVANPGEFAVSGAYIYYVPRSGAPTNVVMPTTMDVVSFLGTDASTRVSHVAFDGVTIDHADANTWYRFSQPINFSSVTYQNYQQQNTAAQHGGILIENADNVSITNTRIANTGVSGIFLEGYVQYLTVAHSLIEHTGNDGIYGDGPPPGSGDIQNHNSFTDLIVRNFAELNIGFGIHLNQSSFNMIGPGECYLGPADCIGLTGWLDVSPTSDMYTHDNTITGWRVHDAVQDTGDRGAVKFEFMTNVGTNLFTNSTIDGIYPSTTMLDLGPGGVNGILLDNQTQGQTFTNIFVSNTQGTLLRRNTDGTGPIVTNCSFKADATVNNSFDESQLNFSAIGATSSNPWQSTTAFTSFDDFEGSFGNFTSLRGSPTISTDQAHTGTHSVKQTASGDLFYFQPGRRVYQHFEIYMYDAGATVDAMCSPDELVYASGDYQSPTYTLGNYAAVGIWPAGSTSFYAFWINRIGTVTTVPRSNGWHHFLWDASTGGSVTVSIDGTAIGTVPGMPAISQIRIGDLENLGHTGNVYWDGARLF